MIVSDCTLVVSGLCLGLPVDSSLSEWVVFPLYFQLCFHGPGLVWICSEVCPDRCSSLVSDCFTLVMSGFLLVVSVSGDLVGS